jgi:hypothetical protein
MTSQGGASAAFVPQPGDTYRISEGIRRAKAAKLAGHNRILAEVFHADGTSLGVHWLPLDALFAWNSTIRRVTRADEIRWKRAESGARQVVLPYPPILVYHSQRGTALADVQFDFVGNP